MSLQLILGGAGSGKTALLHDRIIEASIRCPDQLYFIIVPEQFTMQTQKDIVSRHPCRGTMNIDIVSFQRLAFRIFEELAVDELAVLDDMGKSMVLRKAVAACRKQLLLFGRHLGQPGFISRLRTTISEFYQYGITPEILNEMAPKAKSPLLKQKLNEFSLIFKEFQDYIEGHYITTEEVLDVLCRVLPRSKLIKNSVVALDGYAGFMPVQFRLLELFMIHAKQVLVTVTADPAVPVDRPLGMQDLFSMSSQLVCRLLKLAGKNHVEVLPYCWLRENPHRSPALAFLEQNLFRYRKAVYEGELNGEMELYQAANPAKEAARTARQIQKLVKDEGLRYRDIAVVTGDLEGYGRELSQQFARDGIPFFLDDKRTILDNPLVELIRAALETMQKDFSYESIFRYLHSGMAWDTQNQASMSDAASQSRLDRMENYVLAMGIRGEKRWKERWERLYRGAKGLNLEELNSCKDAVAAPLFALSEAFRKKPLAICDMAEALRQLLEDVHAKEQLEAFQVDFARRGEFRLEKEYSQVYEIVEGLLECLSGLLGEEQVSRREFAEILDAGFSEISVGVIPATVDRIVIGDIMRTRLAHIRVLFFLGMNDGIVPQKREGGSLLTDQEREFFYENQLELAPTAREDVFMQRFFLYRVMAKPVGKLLISYAEVGADGRSRRPSYVIGELWKMFPQLPFEKALPWEDDAWNLPEVYSVEEAKQRLIVGLGKYRDGGASEDEAGTDRADEWEEGGGQNRFFELYRWFAQREEGRKELPRLVDAAFYVYERQGISRAAARALYGRVMSGSVTRLEQYAQCAYAHFLNYGLELLERQEYELRAEDIGNLFHESIDRCFKKVFEDGRNWRSITDEERQAIVHEAVSQAAMEYGNTILNSSSRNAFLARRVEQIAQRTVWALQQQIARGDFEPAGFEVTFSAADNLDAMKIALSEEEELHLRGRVDRLDLYEDEGHIYVKIIDYKSGNTSFDLMALYYGLQLQLVVYMDAVIELMERRSGGKEVVPAGILYYNIADPVVARETSLAADGTCDAKLVEKEILKQLKMNGLIHSDPEIIRHMDHEIDKESDIIPVVIKGDEVLEGRSCVAGDARFKALRKYVRGKVKMEGQEILSGEISIAPYKSGARTACDYCPYHAVCGFDKKTGGYEYRRLKKKKSEEIWGEICQ